MTEDVMSATEFAPETELAMLMGIAMFASTLYRVHVKNLPRVETERELRRVLLPFCFLGAVMFTVPMSSQVELPASSVALIGLMGLGGHLLLRYPIAYLLSWYCIFLSGTERRIRSLKRRLLWGGS